MTSSSVQNYAAPHACMLFKCETSKAVYTLARPLCPLSTRNRSMLPILYLLNGFIFHIHCISKIYSAIYTVNELFLIIFINTNFNVFTRPKHSRFILNISKLNWKNHFVPYNKINESQLEIVPWSSYWIFFQVIIL